ncbi:MAG: sigma-70 family RNA polymerase sigma factor [Novosphingobium sp.]|nr:sigma-70 family RNA polymerase sigma factor [Novosphingobium sp.]
MDVQEREGGLVAVLQAHRGELLRFLAARSGDPAGAEDLLQELWLKASRQPGGPIADPRAYLYRMANNLVLDTLRARQRGMTRDRNWLQEDGGGDTAPEHRLDPALPADQAIARAQEIALLRQAIAALPPGAREALRLFRFEGKPQAEIAEIMGISRSGVEKHLAAAMRHLRNSLADCGSGDAAASGKQGAHGVIEPVSGKRP